MLQLERDLSRMFFGAPRKPKPCKRYRVQVYATGRNRFFSTRPEAVEYAKEAVAKTGDAAAVLTRVNSMRARCADVWSGQETIEP